jgi:hypothetical protein
LGVLARASLKEDSMKVARRLLILLVFVMPSLWAKDLLNIHESNPLVEKCLQEILSSQLIKHKYPDLLTNQHNPSGYQFLKEVDQYCSCHAKNLSFEEDLKKKDYIAFEFRDKSKSHEVMDQCSLNSFSKYNLGVFFEMIVSTRVRHTIENKLEGRMIAGIKHFASEGSVRNRLFCLETKILKRCTKIQSIHSTFKCVGHIISNSNRMDKIGKSCPNFKPLDHQEQDFQAMGDII